MKQKKTARTANIVLAALVVAAVLTSCTTVAESKVISSSSDITDSPVSDSSSDIVNTPLSETPDDAGIPEITGDITRGLDFQIDHVSGAGSVMAELTNAASPYKVVAVTYYWVEEENGELIPFIEGTIFHNIATNLGIGNSVQYAFMGEELQLGIKPGNYIIYTTVTIQTSDSKQPEVQEISVPFTYAKKLIEITPEHAEKLTVRYIDSLNSGEDLAVNYNEAIESWRKWLGTDNPQFRLQPNSLKQRENADGYEFTVDSLVGDAIYTATVYIELYENAIYYAEPLYYCSFSRYYPAVEARIQEYLAGLTSGDAGYLALSINPDDLPYGDAEKEAQRQLDYYSSRYDLSSLKVSGSLMYDDYTQRFQQVILDANDNGFVLTYIFGDGLVSIEPPPEDN